MLSDPETLTGIYKALSQAVTDIAAKDEVTNQPEVIRLALKLHAQGEGGAQ